MLRIIGKISLYLYRCGWGFALGFVVLVGLYLGLGRYVTEQLPNYQGRIASYLSDITGLDVNLEGLSGEWQGFTPTIRFNNLSLSSPDNNQVVLSVNEGLVEAAVLRSLLKLQPEVKQITVDNAHIRLQQLDDRRWSMAGIEPSSTTGPIVLPNWLTDALLSLHNLVAKRMDTTLDFKNGQSERIEALAIKLQSDGHFRRGRAAVSCGGCGASAAIFESFGDPRHSSYQARAYVELNEVQTGNFSELVPSEYAPLFSHDVNGRFWAEINEGYKVNFSADLAVPKLGLGSIWLYPERYLRDGYVKLSGEGSLFEPEWEVYFQNVTGEWEGQALDYSGIGMLFDIAKMSLQFQVAEFDAHILSEQVINGPATPDKLREILKELAPSGKLKQLSFTLPLMKAEMRENISMTAVLEQVSINAWKGVPGIKSLSGYFHSSIKSGELIVEDDALFLDLPFIYDKALSLQNTKAHLAWQISETGLQIESGRIDLDHGKASAKALISLDLPFKREYGDPEMSLLIGISNADASMRKNFIPKTLPDDLLEWLDQGVKQAEVSEGAYLYRGSLRPQARLGRSSQLYLDVRNAELDYHRDWPAVAQADAQLHIDDADVLAVASTGRMFDNIQLEKAFISVLPSPTVDKPVLHVEANAKSNVRDGLRLINESVLRKSVGDVFSNWQGEGQLNAKLGLHIPLYKNGKPEIFLDADIEGQTLQLKDLDLSLSNLRGKITYGKEGIASSNLKASIFDKPLDIDVWQEPSGQVNTRVNGSASVVDLQSWINQPFLNIAKGETDFDILIEAGGANAVTVSSNLVGVELQLPTGLYKAAAEPRALSLNIPLGNGPQRWDASLAETGQFAVLMNGAQMDAATIKVGPRGIDLPSLPPRGIRVTGQLENGELEETLDLIKLISSDLSSTASTNQQSAANSTKVAMPIAVDNLFVRRATVLEQRFNDLTLSLTNGQAGGETWQIRLQSPDVAGEVVVPLDDETPIRLMLSELHLPSLESKSKSQQTESKLAQVNPAELINIDADIEALVIGDELWGDLGFSLRSDNQGALFSNIRGAVRGLRLDPGGENTSLYWRRDTEGHHSAFTGRILAPNIGEAFERWGYERIVEGKNGELGIDIRWSAEPDRYDLALLDGRVVIDTEEGRFPKSVEQAEGALKIVGVLNFGNLLRRLQFDFKDVFQKGVHFDDVDGELLFDNGMIHLKEPIDIDGPASRFLLSGDINCNIEQVDMELMATLPVGTNLPWIAGLVGGLPAAAGMYVASKLFEKQLDQASSAIYTVKGNWAEPDVKFKKLFDVEPQKATSATQESSTQATEVSKPLGDNYED